MALMILYLLKLLHPEIRRVVSKSNVINHANDVIANIFIV